MPETPPSAREIAALFLSSIEQWYESKRLRTGRVNTNVMSAGLMTTEHMADAFPLSEEDYSAPSQVKKLGGRRIEIILARHGEYREFTSEGGRTSRGTILLVAELAEVLNTSPATEPYLSLPPDIQWDVRNEVQGWFVERVRVDYFDRQRIAVDLDPNKPPRRSVAALLQAARARGGYTAGAVAQHLVGAKLALRFPDYDVSNKSYSTADQQTDRPGDFLVGDTAIHVTISPGENLMSSRAQANLRDGFRPLVLVPEDRVAAARQLADNAGIGDRVGVNSIEDFVGTNIEEIAAFVGPAIRSGLRALLDLYNQRVEAVEPDPSLRIKIPGNL